VVGSAFGAWWLTSYRRAQMNRGQLQPRRARGEVIFDNTPVAPDTDAII
jgi:hypothetical protein